MLLSHVPIVVALVTAVPPERPIAPEDVGKPYIRHRDMIYAETDGVGLLMDVFVPIGRPNGLGIVDVVSGAWFSDRGKLRDHERADLFGVFCERGYTVFAIRPGSITKYTGFEMLEHIRRGIRWVKAHAADYRVDPARLGLVGASAGGHLACLTAVTPEDGKPDARDPLDRLDTRMAAVAVFFPPTDFLDYSGSEISFDLIGRLLYPGGLGERSLDQAREQARLLSPARRVRAPTPPFLFIHGDRDPMVPLQQSRRMVEALREVGGEAELIVKPGGGHPWFTIREEVVRMAEWFDGKLQRSATSRPAK